MKSHTYIRLRLMYLFSVALSGIILVSACTGNSPDPREDDVASNPTIQASLPSPTGILPKPVPTIGSAGFWQNNFTLATPGTELSATSMIQVHPDIPVHSDIRLNPLDPGYYRFEDEPAGFGFFPRIIRLQNGDLLAVFKEGAHEPVPSGRSVAVRSEDGGATWSDPIVVVDFPNINDGPLGLLQQKDGKVLVGGWVVPPEAANRLYDWDGFLVGSDDSGRTWGPLCYWPMPVVDGNPQ